MKKTMDKITESILKLSEGFIQLGKDLEEIGNKEKDKLIDGQKICSRCEESIKDGIPYGDEIYCNSCVSYFEARADNETDRLKEEEAGIETEL